MTDLFDYAAKARDEALAQVTEPKWSALAKDFAFTHIPFDKPMIGEEIRELLLAKGLPAPKHHNAWGAFIMGLRRGEALLLKPTGGRRKMRGLKSHARETAEYVRA